METSTVNKNVNLQFKTNINCSGCVAQIADALNKATGICHWHVDTDNKDKILSVHSNGITNAEVIKTVQSAGFTIESIKS